MEVKEKIRLFQRFLKELGLYKIYMQDNKICKRDNLRKTVLYLNNEKSVYVFEYRYPIDYLLKNRYNMVSE